MGHGSILGLDRRSYHHILFLVSPKNQITSHKCAITRSELPIIETPSPIGIGIDFDPPMPFFTKEHTFSGATLEIPQDLIHNFLV
jgi:hypothetical protein